MTPPDGGGASEEPPISLPEALAQLREAQETLRAIRSGEVDAFVVSDGRDGLGVFSLSTTDRPYRMFVERMREGAATVATDGAILYSNDRLATFVGRARDAIVGEKIHRLIAGDDSTLAIRLAEAALSGDNLELDLLGRGEALVPVLVGASFLEIDGAPVLCLTFTDLSIPRAQEAEIERLHQDQVAAGLRFAAVVEGLEEGVLVQDDRGRVLEANLTASKILGVAHEDLVTEPPSPLHWEAVLADGSPMPPEQSPGRQALRTGEPVLGMVIGVPRGDDIVWVEINLVPLRLPSEPDHPVLVSSFRDITTRVATDEAIRFQAQLLDSAGQAIVAVDVDGVVIYWNQHAEHMYGWTATEATGRSVDDLMLTPEVMAIGPDIVDQMRAGGTWSSDQRLRHRDGRIFPVFVTSTPVTNARDELVAMISVATDITERKAAEDRSRRLSAIVESSSDAIIGMTLQRVITTWNLGAVDVFGYPPEEAVGQSVSMLAAASEPEHDPFQVVAGAEAVLREVETQCVTKHGVLVDVSLSVSPILDEDGEPIGLSCIARDITRRIALERIAEEARLTLLANRHQAELEALATEEATRSSQAKSEFLSRMSHELRTPLNAVLGFGELLLMDDLDAEQRESVKLICNAGAHLLDLINDVLDITRIEAGALRISLEPVDVTEVVTAALTLMGPQAAERNVTLPTIAMPSVYVHADRQRLLQVLLNLLSNAVKYNRSGGRIEVECSTTGAEISIAVTDTGLGIAADDLGRIFTPFERLEAESTPVEGTGIGLALSLVLSEQMGGSLSVSSTLGTGSTFTLGLPAGEPIDLAQADEAILRGTHEDRPPSPSPSRAITVLAIEDNVANIRLLERVMEHCENAELVTAIQGQLGMELAVLHQPDLVLLDLHLPDIPGETVLRMLQHDPATATIPIVICSGDASPRQRIECLEGGAADYLTKPFRVTELLSIIEQVRAGLPLRPSGEAPLPEA